MCRFCYRKWRWWYDSHQLYMLSVKFYCIGRRPNTTSMRCVRQTKTGKGTCWINHKRYGSYWDGCKGYRIGKTWNWNPTPMQNCTLYLICVSSMWIVRDFSGIPYLVIAASLVRLLVMTFCSLFYHQFCLRLFLKFLTKTKFCMQVTPTVKVRSGHQCSYSSFLQSAVTELTCNIL